jgi:hypothetical protein
MLTQTWWTPTLSLSWSVALAVLEALSGLQGSLRWTLSLCPCSSQLTGDPRVHRPSVSTGCDSSFKIHLQAIDAHHLHCYLLWATHTSFTSPQGSPLPVPLRSMWSWRQITTLYWTKLDVRIRGNVLTRPSMTWSSSALSCPNILLYHFPSVSKCSSHMQLLAMPAISLACAWLRVFALGVVCFEEYWLGSNEAQLVLTFKFCSSRLYSTTLNMELYSPPPSRVTFLHYMYDIIVRLRCFSYLLYFLSPPLKGKLHKSRNCYILLTFISLGS